jgi:hypothetical protein
MGKGMYAFSQRSFERLNTCDHRLINICNEAIEITPIDFTVLHGFRDEISQNIAYQEGKSKAQWPNSKHNNSPSKAIDLAPWPIDWKNKYRFHMLAGVILSIANELSVDLIWGGFWGWDFGHFEIKEF